MATNIASDLMIFSGGGISIGSLLLAAQRAAEASSTIPPPTPYEDVEYGAEVPPVDLSIYYAAGFIGAVLFGAGIMLKFRGKEAVKVPI